MIKSAGQSNRALYGQGGGRGGNGGDRNSSRHDRGSSGGDRRAATSAATGAATGAAASATGAAASAAGVRRARRRTRSRSPTSTGPERFQHFGGVVVDVHPRPGVRDATLEFRMNVTRATCSPPSLLRRDAASPSPEDVEV